MSEYGGQKHSPLTAEQWGRMADNWANPTPVKADGEYFFVKVTRAEENEYGQIVPKND